MSEPDIDPKLKSRVEQSLKEFVAWGREVRKLAIQRLREMGPDAVDILHELVNEKVNYSIARRDRQKVAIWSAWTILGLAGMSYVVSETPIDSDYHSWVNPLVWLLILVALAKAAQATLRKSPANQKMIVEVLAELADPRSSRYLIESLDTGGWHTKAAARAALIRILPGLSDADATLVPIEQRRTLYRRMSYRDLEFTRAILLGAPAFDDFVALPIVKRLAARDSSVNRADIQDIAAMLVPVLEARREAQNSDRTLLRPSSGADTFPETALRAANSDGASEPGLLLRAADDEG